MSNEVWKDIPGFLGYQVSNLGKVRTCSTKRNQWKRTVELTNTWRERIPCRHSKNSKYLILTLYTSETPSKLVCFKMHRLVWELFVGPIPSNYQIDHINHDCTDNRLENLRLANNSQNHMNQKPREGRKFKGICSNGNKFSASITLNKVRKYLGNFDSEKEAALAYNKEAIKLFGEFAKLNSIIEV